MRRKVTAAVLLLLLLVCLSACGDKEDEDDIHNYNKTGEYESNINDAIPTATEDDLITKPPVNGTATPTPTPKPAKQYIVVLDPGHGGNDPGASYDGRKESYLNLQLANLVKEYLTSNYSNVTVILTREDENTKPSLSERVDVGLDNKADIVVSLHLDATESHKSHGASVLISKQPNITEQSKKLANCILKNLESLGIKNNGTVKKDSKDTFDENGVPVDYYGICRYGAANNIIALIVESCYIDSDIDADYLKSDMLPKMAEAEAKGIMEFLTKHYNNGAEG